MTEVDDELPRALASPSLEEAIRRALELLAPADRATLERAAAVAREVAERDPEGQRGMAGHMVLGAALARAALVDGDVFDGSVDEAVAALNALATSAAGPAREEAFAPLGAYLLAAEVPQFVDMRVDNGDDDVVFTWTSGAMALRRIARGA